MTTDLTRAEIEALAADIHTSHPWHKAITQLLAQLDAASSNFSRLSELSADVQNRLDQSIDRCIAANARADAAAGQMREKCAVAAQPTMAQMLSDGDSPEECNYRAGMFGSAARIRALPLHEEPNNDAG